MTSYSCLLVTINHGSISLDFPDTCAVDVSLSASMNFWRFLATSGGLAHRCLRLLARDFLLVFATRFTNCGKTARNFTRPTVLPERRVVS